MSPLLVQALHRQPTAYPPLWLMRQAGRYLPEYRAVRANFPNFMSFCLHPEAATEVTLQPITRFGIDAAIIFADILTIPHALGHTVTFTEGHGPRVVPITKPEDVTALAARLPEITPTLAPVSATVAATRQALAPEKAVIGFSGGPFTLACYMLDEKPSQGIPNTLAFATEHPAAFTQLLSTLAQAAITYLSDQIRAGANAVQLFESWALACPPELWHAAVHTPLTTIAKALHTSFPATPVILFPRGGTQAQLQAFTAHPEVSALSLSTETNLTWAAEHLQPHLALQGNLNPVHMVNPDPTPMLTEAKAILQTATQKPGFVFNLGHGLTPDTKPDNVQKLVDFVHAWQSR